jgi:integrase
MWIFDDRSLNSYCLLQCNGLSQSSIKTIHYALHYFITVTDGRVSREILIDLSRKIWDDPKHSVSHKNKLHIYISSFIKYLAEELDDPALENQLRYFRKPRCAREIKMLTTRIIVVEDIQHAIENINNTNSLSDYQKLRYSTFLIFLAYTGQRPMTTERITVSQFKQALSQDPPVLTVLASQDKNRMEHLVPLHSELVPFLERVINGKKDDDKVFNLNSLQMWFKRNPQSMIHTRGKLHAMDLRKFFEQKSDEIGFVDSHKNLIMSHGCGSIGWKSYKQFLPENVYKTYMKHWGSVEIINSNTPNAH